MRRVATTYETAPHGLTVVESAGEWVATADAIGQGKTARQAMEDLERVLASELRRVRATLDGGELR